MSYFFMSLLGSFMAPKVLVALAGVLALILLDFILGALVAMKTSTFDVRKLPQFLETSFVPYVGGLLILALFSNTDPTLSVLFFATSAAVYAKFLADIKTKLAQLFVGFSIQLHNPIEVDHAATKPVAPPETVQPVVVNVTPDVVKTAPDTQLHPAIAQVAQLLQQVINQPIVAPVAEQKVEAPAIAAETAPVAQPAV